VIEMKTLPILLSCAVLAGCVAGRPAPLGPQPTESSGLPLSPTEVRDEVVGNTGTGKRTSTHAHWNVYVAPDGTLASNSPQAADHGQWRITDDGMFCMRWQIDWDGREVCQIVRKKGAAIELSSPTSLEILTFMPGNRLAEESGRSG
jgi:hypothetical protein